MCGCEAGFILVLGILITMGIVAVIIAAVDIFDNEDDSEFQ